MSSCGAVGAPRRRRALLVCLPCKPCATEPFFATIPRIAQENPPSPRSADNSTQTPCCCVPAAQVVRISSPDTHGNCAFAHSLPNDDRPGLPFLSVGATFNHIIFADALWYMRITGAESLPHVLPVTIPDATALAGFWRDGTRFGQAIPDIEEASERMTAMSDTWVDFVDGLDADKLEDEFSYADTKGQSHTQQLSRILGHVVNHATHHRGQISAVVNKLTGQYHVSDMPPFFESPEAELP